MIDRSLFSIHFEQLKTVNFHTQEFDASMVLGKICYRLENTVIEKKGLKAIPATHASLAKELGCSVGKIKDLLNKLENYRLIQIVIGSWYRVKSSFFSVKEGVNFKPNMRKIKFLNKISGGYRETVMYLRFLYESSMGCLCTYGRDWVRVAFSEFKALLTCSMTTCNDIKKQLIERGLIECEGGYAGGEQQYYARINQKKYNEILTAWIEEDRKYQEAIKAKKELKKQTQKTKFVVSYNSRDLNTRSIINNNIEDIDIRENRGDIVTLKESVYVLNDNDWAYAKVALERTVLKAQVQIQDVKRLWKELQFALITPEHTKRMDSFKHAINSFMVLIRSGKWKMPFGYHKYSHECKEGYDHIRKVEADHYASKSARALLNLRSAQQLPTEISISRQPPPKLALEPKLGGIEYFKPDVKKSSYDSAINIANSLKEMMTFEMETV